MLITEVLAMLYFKKSYQKVRDILISLNTKKEYSPNNEYLSYEYPSLLQELEPRFMFDGAAIETVDLADGVSEQEQAYILNAIEQNEQAHATDSLLQAIEENSEGFQTDYSQFKEVVIIDARVKDPHILIESISRTSAIEVILPDQDGVDRIAEVLTKYTDLDAVHIVSHGAQAELQLGNVYLNETSLTAYQPQLQQWGDALTAEGDILFYGCNVAEGNEGKSFIDSLKKYTSADIASSDNPTGAGDIDGDSNLEYSLDIESMSILKFENYTTLLDINDNEKIVYASDGAAADYFGESALISSDGNTAVISARNEDGPTDSGSIYIFKKIGTEWLQVQKIKASDAGISDHFGTGLAISEDGNIIVVGSPLHNDSASVTDTGAVYIYSYDDNDSEWKQLQKITADDKVAGDRFGFDVDISDDESMIAVTATGVGNDTGAVYFYEKNGSTWDKIVKIDNPSAIDSSHFGSSVSLSSDGTRAVVSSMYEDTPTDSGRAYVFNYNGSSWSQMAQLEASDKEASDVFSSSVSISGDGTKIAVGSYLEDGVAGDSGSVYIYTYNGSNWNQIQKITASDGAASDLFGTTVTLSYDGKKLLVGSPGDDSPVDSGSVYLYSVTAGDMFDLSTENRIKASDAQASDLFGGGIGAVGTLTVGNTGMDKYGETIVVGAYLEDTKGGDAGAAYFYSDYDYVVQWAQTATATSEFSATTWGDHQATGVVNGAYWSSAQSNDPLDQEITLTYQTEVHAKQINIYERRASGTLYKMEIKNNITGETTVFNSAELININYDISYAVNNIDTGPVTQVLGLNNLNLQHTVNEIKLFYDHVNNTGYDHIYIDAVSLYGDANDAPVLTAGATLNYTENDSATAIDTTIVISDVDDT
ncbi:DUF4347 domain-containing protein, partial [Cysteiniphilum halobium]|uniref:DUF4347 domain-containing protein n=1 Tax=Cysteiniphilum halobium TaxID=2219059 RepID=UPI003F844C76